MTKYISASSVGRAEYCPYALYLEKGLGKVASKETQHLRSRGNTAHEALNQTAEQTKQDAKPCFIATYACGQNAFETRVLRQFRDSTLRKSRAGRWLIASYYKTSPIMINWMSPIPLVRYTVRGLLLLISAVLKVLQ